MRAVWRRRMPGGVPAEGPMTTLIDVIVLLIAYGGVSLGCAALGWLLRLASPRRDSYEGAVARARSVRA